MKTLLHACAKALPATAGWLLTAWLLASAAALPARGQFLTKEVMEAGLNGSEEDFKQALRKSVRQKMEKYRKEHSFRLTVSPNKNNKTVQFEEDSLLIVQSTANPGNMQVIHTIRGIRTIFSGMAKGTRMAYTFSLRNVSKQPLQLRQSGDVMGSGIWEYTTRAVPPGGMLTITVRDLSLNYGQSTSKIYLPTNDQGILNLSVELYADTITPSGGQVKTLNKTYIPWDDRANNLEQQAEDRRQQENERKRLAEEAERKRARQALEAALADTVYPYVKRTLSNNLLNFCMKQYAYDSEDEDIGYQIAIEDAPGKTVMLLIGMESYGILNDIKEAIMKDSRTTNQGDSLYILRNYPIALHLSNGETLSTRQGSIYYEIISTGFLFFPGEEYIMPFMELLPESDRKDLSGLSVMQQHAYTVSRLSRYNIESITLDGTTFKLGDVRTANTLKAMFADAEKATGDTGKYHYTEPSAQATPAASTQPSESEADTGDTYEPPSFPGGSAAMMQYIAQNLRYPKAAQEAGVQGRVMLQFTVGQDGTLSDIKVLRSVSAEIDAEAVRVVRSMPRWTPAKANGKPISARYMVPVAFRLQ